MANLPQKPLVGVPASVTEVGDSKVVVHQVGKRYIDTLAHFSHVVPMVIPSLADGTDFPEIVARIDGLFLTGGRANIEPHHYDGPPFPDDEIRDPNRDALVLPLIRACVNEGVPIFGTCRGIQELNVALGGSLHYRIHELPGKMDHRMPREGTMEQRFAERHGIALTPGGLFATLVGREEANVNSLHGQGVDRLGHGLVVEAVAPDGVIEGISMPDAKALTFGAQWHVEWDVANHKMSRALYEAFGKAAREHMEGRSPAASSSAVRAAE